MEDNRRLVGSKTKRRGHWCWACNRLRANECFSGGGHARHICRECQKRPAPELAYRQAVRDLERCITWEGIIPRKRRGQFNAFLQHDDARIRQLAAKMLADDQASRRSQRFKADDLLDRDEIDECLSENDTPCDEEGPFNDESESPRID